MDTLKRMATGFLNGWDPADPADMASLGFIVLVSLIVWPVLLLLWSVGALASRIYGKVK